MGGIADEKDTAARARARTCPDLAAILLRAQGVDVPVAGGDEVGLETGDLERVVQALQHGRLVEPLRVVWIQRGREQPLLRLRCHRVRAEMVQVARVDAPAQLRIDEPGDEVAGVRVVERYR